MNGVKTIYRGWQSAVPFFLNGLFNVSVDNGTHRNSSAYTNIGAFTIDSNNYLTGTVNTYVMSKTLVSSQKINFANYSKITLTDTAISPMEMNVSGYNGEGYLCVTFKEDQHGGRHIELSVSTAKEDYNENLADNLYMYSQYPNVTCQIESIIIE